MTTSTTDKRRTDAGYWVAVLTVLWFVSVPPLVLWAIFESLSFTSDPNPNAGKGAVGFLVAGLLTMLLPLTAAVVALRGGRPVLGGVYLVLTVLLAVLGAALIVGATQTLGWWPETTDVPAPAASGICRQPSGGLPRCPGG